MDPPSPRYVGRACTALAVTVAVYLVMNGAQLFETLAVVPSWAGDPPRSLSLLRGPHGLDFQVFWIVVHSIHELTFLAAIVLCWRFRTTRNTLLVLFAFHLAVRVWTLVYFAPEIIAFGRDPLSAAPDGGVITRVALWQDLNHLRVAVFVAVSLGVLVVLRNLERQRAGRGSARRPHDTALPTPSGQGST